MRSLNKAQIIGHLGSDPELRYTSGNTAVANFSVATNAPMKDDPEWHNITAWDDLAEIVHEHLSKGERVYVEGPIRTSEWEDSDGKTRYTTEIHANEVIFLGSDPSAETPSGGQPQREPAGGEEQEQFEPDDSLPF